MREIVPGLYHWTAIHPRIHSEVSSYFLADGGVLIDPLIPPDEGLEWFAARPQPPAAVVLSNRHHFRHSDRFAQRFACPIYCVRQGMHEFAGAGEAQVTPFDFGDELPGGIVAEELDGICPDDTALHLRSLRALAFADGIVRAGADGSLGFVPDSLMDDPPGTKRDLLEGLSHLLEELDFEHVLLAHGYPLIGTGREAVRDLVGCGGRTAFEL